MHIVAASNPNVNLVSRVSTHFKVSIGQSVLDQQFYTVGSQPSFDFESELAKVDFQQYQIAFNLESDKFEIQFCEKILNERENNTFFGKNLTRPKSRRKC